MKYIFFTKKNNIYLNNQEHPMLKDLQNLQIFQCVEKQYVLYMVLYWKQY